MIVDLSRNFNGDNQQEKTTKQETTQVSKIDRQIENNATAKQKALEVYQEYLENKKKSNAIVTNITKGIDAGEDITTLFLQAIEVIGLITGEYSLLSRLQLKMAEKYGVNGK